MTAFALAALIFSLLSALVLTAGRRRRRGDGGALPVARLPAGLAHLASRVSALSSFGMDLRVPAHRPRRRSTLLGVR